MSSRTIIAIGDTPLTLADVTALARRQAGVALSAGARGRVTRARDVVDRLVDKGVAAYGITTGIGSQKDSAVSREGIERYNTLMTAAHATMAPGPNDSNEVIRGALAIQLALFAMGQSGVRLELVESLVARVQADDLPAARLGSSVGASDIVAMSQLAVPS